MSSSDPAGPCTTNSTPVRAGKTWLALTWTHRYWERFPDGQLYVNLHGFSPSGHPTDPAVAVCAEVVEAIEDGIGPVAVYGRCSTEDNQDPETSRGWQFGNARKFVEPLGGVVAEEFFDVGQSRSVPWERREEAARLLAALKNPYRGWNAVVVGEGTRCWFGNQFSLVAPKFAAYGVDLWVPELGGKFDDVRPGAAPRSRPGHPSPPGHEPAHADARTRSSRRARSSASCAKDSGQTERAERPTKRPYLFRGIVRCTACGRKMEASPRVRGVYYRCPARTLAPGSPALATHPPTVYLREDILQEAVNGWLGLLFAPENGDRTVAALVES
ncbi:recombinase family protein, partial [Actinosynnema sp. NPDC023658]|uniref:zinc ribbon domain-containing protein n=1 Tax=Actinosynnema sp. NPDC023658 TaxID=3155465 RepID=UPI0033D8D50B